MKLTAKQTASWSFDRIERHIWRNASGTMYVGLLDRMSLRGLYALVARADFYDPECPASLRDWAWRTIDGIVEKELAGKGA